MVSLNELFEPQNEMERDEFAVEALALSIQLALQKSMHAGCVSQKELSERLGVTAARVSQLLSTHGANLTIKTIAKIARALGEDFEFISAKELRALRRRTKIEQLEQAQEYVKTKDSNQWIDQTANTNKSPRLIAA